MYDTEPTMLCISYNASNYGLIDSQMNTMEIRYLVHFNFFCNHSAGGLDGGVVRL